MASDPSKDNLAYVYDTLAPLLAAASIGEFSAEIDLTRNDDPRVNELLMGYQVLLDVIRQQSAELTQYKSDNPARAHRETLTLLDDILSSRD